MEQAYLTTKQAAQYLGIGYSTAKKNWPEWIKYGVNPSRLNGRSELRFKKSELDALMNAWRVIK